MKRKGFTLIELLGILTLISIITMMIVLIVGPAIQRQKKKAFIETCNGIIESAELYAANNGYVFPSDQINLILPNSPIKLKNKEQITAGYVYMQNTIIYIKNVTNGLYCGNGTKAELEITEGNCG